MAPVQFVLEGMLINKARTLVGQEQIPDSVEDIVAFLQRYEEIDEAMEAARASLQTTQVLTPRVDRTRQRAATKGILYCYFLQISCVF